MSSRPSIYSEEQSTERWIQELIAMFSSLMHENPHFVLTAIAVWRENYSSSLTDDIQEAKGMFCWITAVQSTCRCLKQLLFCNHPRTSKESCLHHFRFLTVVYSNSTMAFRTKQNIIILNVVIWTLCGILNIGTAAVHEVKTFGKFWKRDSKLLFWRHKFTTTGSFVWFPSFQKKSDHKQKSIFVPSFVLCSRLGYPMNETALSFSAHFDKKTFLKILQENGTCVQWHSVSRISEDSAESFWNWEVLPKAGKLVSQNKLIFFFINLSSLSCHKDVSTKGGLTTRSGIPPLWIRLMFIPQKTLFATGFGAKTFLYIM